MTTSTRDISVCGRVLISTLPSAFEAGRRMPSSRTSVRCWPKLRRLRKSPAPLLPALVRLRLDKLFWKIGSLFRASATFVGVVVSNCSVLTAVIGVGELAMSEMTRDLRTTPLKMQQTLTVYLFAYAVMSLWHGALSDAVGRKPVIVGSLVVYALALVLAYFLPVAAVVLYALLALYFALPGAGRSR